MKIAEDEVHLWYVRDEQISDPDLLARYRAFLCKDELVRLRRFRFEKHRHQYLIARALVRCVLSLYADSIPPAAWEFGAGEYGKPYIRNSPLPAPLSFNLSHTDKMAVLAVTSGRDIGVDVEYAPRDVNLEVAEKYFSAAEHEDLTGLPAERQKSRFLDLWTLKEAYIKARGMGLSIPLDRFSFSFPGHEEIQISFHPLHDDDPRHWSFWQIRPDATHVVGLATRGVERYRLSMRELVPLKSVAAVDCPIVARSRQTFR